MAEWLCLKCKVKFPNEYKHEQHDCNVEMNRPKSFFDTILQNPFSRRKQVVKCGKCGNQMDTEKYAEHACVKAAEEKAGKASMKIALFVASKRMDTRSMRLAATEFRGAQYLIRGVSTEEPFIKIAREMGSAIYQFAPRDGKVGNLDHDILKKADIALMFPSRDQCDVKDTFKKTMNVDGHKIPTVVYPEA